MPLKPPPQSWFGTWPSSPPPPPNSSSSFRVLSPSTPAPRNHGTAFCWDGSVCILHSYKWTHTCMWCLAWRNDLEIPACCLGQWCIPFHCRVLFHCRTYTTAGLSLHLLLDTILIPGFGYCEWSYYIYLHTSYCVDTCYHNTWEKNKCSVLLKVEKTMAQRDYVPGPRSQVSDMAGVWTQLDLTPCSSSFLGQDLDWYYRLKVQSLQKPREDMNPHQWLAVWVPSV